MKVWVLLMCVCCLSWRSKADPRSYLVTAPSSFCLDATETVLLQLFGFADEVIVTLYLKTSKAVGHTVLAQEEVRLNAWNHHQAIAKVRIEAHQLDKSVNNVILQVQSQTRELNGDILVPVRRSNGFLFIQTDKPLYTPNQSVKVRVFSMNQELRPANRTVFLTFRDPDYTTVDIVSLADPSNGVPSMQNPFKIPIKPKLGIWTIEASYSDMFTTIAKTDFEVREYVLPSISIFMEPELNFISYGQFTRFNFKVSARYLHGAPVVDGDVYVRYGYVIGKDPPVIIPKSVRRVGLSSSGETEITVNMEAVLSKQNGPKTLDSLVGKYLYIAVLVQENGGGISQEAEFASVKFVRSPYSLVLVSTPLFIKPGLPYNMQVMVKDHLNNPVNGVLVKLVEQRLYRQNMPHELNFCSVVSAISQVDGRAPFVCNIPSKVIKAELKFETADPSLPPASQASLPLTPVAYQSTNERYIYIDPPLPDESLEVGRQAQINVYSATPSYIPIRTLSYLVLSKGKVVHANSQNFLSTSDNRQTVRFTVTSSMVPSIRLLVYYILYGEGTSELVADSVWMDVKARCVNGHKTNLTVESRTYRPKENIQLDIKTNHGGLLALSAVDTALFTLRPNYKDPVSMVLRHIEHSDLGCGGGGGKNNADVFRLAGLTFLTNGNAAPITSNEVCTSLVRPRRAVTEADKQEKVNSYRTHFLRTCCGAGMTYIPKSITCQQFALQRFRRGPAASQDCRDAFTACCEFIQEKLDEDDNLVLGRNVLGADFDQTPVMVRSQFPESWLWEAYSIRPGVKTVTKPLPDSLTTWNIKAISMSSTGICVAEPVQVQVTQPVSVDVPLPYQLVRGEQVELSGSVYNQLRTPIKFCLTLTAPSSVCLLQSRPTPGREGLRSTSCKQMLTLHGGGVRHVTFTVLGLEPGEHTLTFTLKTLSGGGDIVEKKLRVVPEGERRELFSGGTLDPGSVYGWPRKTVLLQNTLPLNVVPGSVVKRQVMVNGETLGEVMAVIHSDEGLRELFNIPAGSADWELDRLLLLIHMYEYLEKTNNWHAIGGNTNKILLQTKINQALVSISSFKRPDSSYSRWRNGEGSTWLTAQLVNVMSLADHIPKVQSESAAKSIDWLFVNAQRPGGDFVETSTYKPKKITAAGSGPLDQSVYLTSFVLIALHRASHTTDPIMQLHVPQERMASAASYISQNALTVKSVYVRAVAAYALTLHDPRSQAASSLMRSLENSAIQRDGPPAVRYWQESGVAGGWVTPDQSSGLTVEMTAYVVQTVLLTGGIQYAQPIMAWLTQDQNYGEAFYSPQEAVLTLAALTAYSAATTRPVLNQQVSIRYGKSKYGTLGRPHLTQSMSVATPIEVTKDDDVIVSTDSGTGVATVKMKTVFYQTTASIQNCNFDFNIEMVGERTSQDDSLSAPHLTACVKYKPPPNEVDTSSRLTVMKIQLPTGVEAYLEDLRQFRDTDNPVISHFELDGDTVDIQMDSVPSDIFVCVGFRTRTTFAVNGASNSLFRVYELHDRGSMCSKMFSSEEDTLQRLCLGQECQCMTAACAVYRGNMDSTLTVEKRLEETCRPHIVYAYRVEVKSSAAEGDFMTYTASVSEVIKRADNQFDAVGGGTELQLVKKATCSTVEIHHGKQYLVMGAHGSVVKLGQNNYKYRLALDSEALVEVWPSDCTTPNCPHSDHSNNLLTYAETMQTEGCL